jgi:CHAT domain-containing protein
MYAGAASVLASLWSVEDRATADLMASFYRDRLRQGLSAAEALRRAQLEIAGQPSRKSPYFWAGFSLQGEWK